MKTLVVSDIHIGRNDSNVKDLLKFILANEFDQIIFNGDIFDQFAIWKDKGKVYRDQKFCTKGILSVLKLRKTKVVYTVGNHDWLALLLIPFGFLFGVKIRKRYKFEDYVFEHGDWINLYAKLRGIKEKEFIDKWYAIAEKKNKIFVVGHSHEPQNKCRVIDEGDWVKHNSYAIIENKQIKLKNLES